VFYTITRQKNDREIAFEDSPRTDCFTLIPHCIADHFGDYHGEFRCLHWTMQKNFAKYVADVEMQKLDHLIDNLGRL
jgi:hypothetical protein